MNGRPPPPGGPQGSPGPTRVLFLTWGYSIHARRRVDLFVGDPDFEVAVASTHDYAFAGARNIPLTGAAPRSGEGSSRGSASLARRVLRGAAWRARAVASRALAVHPLLSDVARGVKDFATLRSAVREFRPDVVFLQTLLYPCYIAYFLPRALPIVVTFWNGDVIWWARWNGIERLLKKRIVLHGVRRARAITVNSGTAYDACLGYGSSREKIHLIRYPGVDLERFRPSSREDARKRLGIPFGKVVFCPRGLGGFLNSDVIVRSAARVVGERPDTLFLFASGVGGEEERERHRRMAGELGIGDHVRFEGQVPWEAMPLYYAASDAMVSVSLNDSLPNCMLEAMACGVPVIMGDIPQIREWVADGVNGILVPPRDADALADAILRLFAGGGELSDALSGRNLDIVRREFDSRRNAKLIKDLVRANAGR